MRNMYKIPPSVDYYLGRSSKSMIHFPAVSLDASLVDVVQGSGCTSPDRFLFTHNKSALKDEILDDAVSSQSSFDDDNDRIDKRDDEVDSDIESSFSNDNTKHKPSKRTAMNGKNSSSLCFKRKYTEIRPKQPIGKINHDEMGKKSSKSVVGRKNPWGPQSYSELISDAIRSSIGHKASLQQIYDWIVNNIPYFHDKGHYPSTKGWKNAIRHTLSIRKRFIRIVNDRSPHASLWTFSRHGYRSIAKLHD